MSETRELFTRRISTLAARTYVDETIERFSPRAMTAAAEAVYAQALRDVIEACERLELEGMHSSAEFIRQHARKKGIDLEDAR